MWEINSTYVIILGHYSLQFHQSVPRAFLVLWLFVQTLVLNNNNVVRSKVYCKYNMVNCVRVFFGYIFCGACFVCCGQPFTNCALSDLTGPSCCGVSGCGSCVGNQFNICDNPGGLFTPIPEINAPCIFGSVGVCPCS